MEERQCLECQQILRGRSDKRFCDDLCRNAYNNRINSDQNNYVRNINNILRKNRRILEQMLGKEKMVKIHRDKLLTNGFKQEFHTHYLHTSKGQTYIFCYEYGYLPLENDVLLIVCNKNIKNLI